MEKNVQDKLFLGYSIYAIYIDLSKILFNNILTNFKGAWSRFGRILFFYIYGLIQCFSNTFQMINQNVSVIRGVTIYKIQS